ncbi:DNA primase [Pseudomonas phage PaBG]|uniref:Toprim domain-containing protein n=1 Tax=Pseudomonas phage PaBG TaxID=1335230 RepID=S5VZM0_9CAUD|nr:DNA primase [Pseudomonas phage PaBG]AGS82035.1 putative DNA primase [Pseudomonas phage PaBG]
MANKSITKARSPLATKGDKNKVVEKDPGIIVDDLTHVLEELQEYGGRTKQMGSNVHVLCPFHGEKTPSCSINLSREADVPIGAFFCFGCGEKGAWNKFANQTGLKKLKKWQQFESNTDGGKLRFSKRQIELMGANNMSIQRLFDEVGNAVIPWPPERKWRSYSGKLISRIGGYCYNDDHRDELMLVFPVYTNGRYRGGVRAFFEKQDNGLSYLTTKGDWVKSYGLLGYDYMMKKDLWGCKSIVLVEGPRDWLRLVKNKIPSCGILGSNMFDAKKLQLLVALGIKKIFVMPDNDRAGKKMANLVKGFAKEFGIDCEYLKLPRPINEKGEVVKLDPDNCDQKIIDKVKELVYAVR